MLCYILLCWLEEQSRGWEETYLCVQRENYRQGHWTSLETKLNVKCIWELVSYTLFFASDTDKIVRSKDTYLSSPTQCKDAFRSDIYVSVSVHCFFQNCSTRYNSAVMGFSPHIVSAIVHLLLDLKIKNPKSTLFPYRRQNKTKQTTTCPKF